MSRRIPVVVLGGLLVLAGCGEGGGGRTAAAIRDSAGVAIVEHTAAGVEAMPMLVVGPAEASVGGESADEFHDATFLNRGWLLDEGFVAMNAREARIQRFDASGTMVQHYGRRGEGPDEFQSMYHAPAGGDSVVVVDMIRSTWRLLRPDLSATEPVTFGEGPSFGHTVFGMASDGALLATYRPFGRPNVEESSGPPRRHPRPVIRLAPGANAWDTVTHIRGELVFPTLLGEGGQSFPGERFVTFGAFPYTTVWGDAMVTVDNADWTIDVRNLDGSLRRSIRLDVALRAVTQEIRDSVFARDERQALTIQAGEAYRATFLEQSKRQMFADSVAPYDRILVGREGRLWLRLNETPVDTATTWHAHDAEGRLVARLRLPRGWSLLATDGDRALIRRLDEMDIGYLELRRMVEEGSPAS